jgi:hypothetical protein
MPVDVVCNVDVVLWSPNKWMQRNESTQVTKNSGHGMFVHVLIV